MNSHNHGQHPAFSLACLEKVMPNGNAIGACMHQQHAQRLNEITAAVTYSRVSDFKDAFPTLRNAVLWVLQLELDTAAETPVAHIGPDCRDLNHQKCRGDAWDEAHDHATKCQCECHATADVAALPEKVMDAALTTLMDNGEVAHPMFVRRLTGVLMAAAPFIAAQAKAEALREAADDSRVGPVPYGWNASGVASWLRARAATIEGNDS